MISLSNRETYAKILLGDVMDPLAIKMRPKKIEDVYQIWLKIIILLQ